MIRRNVDGMMLATLREKAGLRQVDLAEQVGCSQPYLSKLETGRHSATLDTIQHIADVLTDRTEQRITVDDLTTAPDACPTCHTPLAQTA